MRALPRFAIAAVLPLCLLSACSLPNQVSNHLNPAALQVQSAPTAKVFLNGKSLGETPINNATVQAGTYTITLQADSGETWSGQVQLYPSTVTSVTRTLTQDPNGGSGQVVQSQEGKGITVIGSPTNASVSVDGKQQGTIPLALPSITSGTHDLTVSQQNYVAQTLHIKVTPGYQTIFTIDLASANATQSATTQTQTTNPSAAPTTGSTTATIGNTGTGWLRVHATAAAGSAEVFRVNTGDSVTVEDTQSGFTKIKTTDGREGWVLSRYLAKY